MAAAKVTMLDDGRNLRLEEPVVFFDSRQRKWEAPAGVIVNGASVPRFFWRLFPPLTGRYREATILHDFYCDVRVRKSSAVHAMFYEKMRADGVSRLTAWTMWAAVRCFGPRF